jgi:hypothetical protein
MDPAAARSGSIDFAAARARWRANPLAFVDDGAVRDPETGQKFELNWSQRQFLKHAFRTGEDGRLLYPELLYSAPKKSGKTAFAAMVVLYVTLILGGRHAEAICVANDLEQSVGRVFAAIRRMVEQMDWLRGAARVSERRIVFPETGASITAIASDYAGAAGSNANVAVFDELWGYTSERSRRLWDELVPPPTRKIACRLTVTYAGFEGESTLLEDLRKRGLAQLEVGKDLHAGGGILMAWHHEPVAAWQTPQWLEQMRSTMRPNAYLRMIENRFVSGESAFVDLTWWDECIDPDMTQVFADKRISVWVGVDASVKHDSTAIVAVTWDKALNKVRLVSHRIFQPTADQPLDFERCVEGTIRQLRERFQVRAVYYDPYQMTAVAQRLAANGVPMRECPQTMDRLTALGSNLYDLIKSRGLVVYPDDAIRLAVSRAVALETPRGWKITKEKTSHKIDVVVALAMAALGCVQEGQHMPAMVGPILVLPESGYETPFEITAGAVPSGSSDMVWEYPAPDYYGERAKQICKENGWPPPAQLTDGGQQAKLRRIIDNELPPPRKVPRKPATAAERHAAAEMGRAMSAAHGGGEYPDLQPGVGFSRFDHPGWS